MEKRALHIKALQDGERKMSYKKKAAGIEMSVGYQTKGKSAGRSLSLRSFFMLVVFGTFCAVVFLSGLAIAGCAAFRHYLLPDANSAYLTIEYVLEDGYSSSSTYLLDFGEESKLPAIVIESVKTVAEEDIGTVTARTDKAEQAEAGDIPGSKVRELVLDATYSVRKLETSYDMLTPKRKLAYRLCGAAMVFIPAMLSLTGILYCGFYFYRKRLSVPLCLLSNATEEIAAQNLDFSLEYDCGDEMGALCRSFELMRRELSENQKAMWKLLEQRRLMQASIAHDLRNPIAIIQGYTEYLLLHLPAGDMNGEKAERIAGNLNLAAKRLEQYTESVRKLNQLEDMEVCRKKVAAGKLMGDIRDDLEMMAAGTGITLQADFAFLEDGREICGDILNVDIVILHRILENIFENATRFAQDIISVKFGIREHMLQITVTDDGRGFPDDILRGRQKNLLPTAEEGHLGMGLAISRLLCEKHGGSMELFNVAPHGGCVKINLSI